MKVNYNLKIIIKVISTL